MVYLFNNSHKKIIVAFVPVMLKNVTRHQNVPYSEKSVKTIL